jgi:serine protease Do
MTESFPSPKKPQGPLTARRLVLLASAAGLGTAVLFGGHYVPQANFPITSSSAHAEVAMRPASFADIVEKVKPAVFAVRVKVEDAAEGTAFGDDNSVPNNMPPGMERFFKRFGFGDMPNGMQPRGRDGRGGAQRHFSMAQGSGFFISADG